jgi:ABC-type dipeptide/oligopeptide/nickel transport system ATPase component
MQTDLHRPLAVIPGRPVDPGHLPPGCAFAARCPLADERCVREEPALVSDDTGRRVACWHAGAPIDPAALAEVAAGGTPVGAGGNDG